MSILVLVGSLRAGSINRQLAHAAIAALPEGVAATIYEGLAELPRYDQDLDGDTPPAQAARLRAAVAAADGVLVVTPEYNGVMPGTIKDAIDWASRPRGESAIAGKPVAVLSASLSPRGGVWARESVLRAVTVAGGRAVELHAGVGSAYEHFSGGELTSPDALAEVGAVVGALVAESAVLAH